MPGDNEKTSAQDGDSSNSEDNSGEHVLERVNTDISDQGADSDDDSVKDYTACSPENCGYCGHCPY